MSQKNFPSYGDMETLLTEIASKCGPYTEITYEDWLQLTPYQQEHGRWDVTGVPGADGTLSIDLMTKLWENPDPTAEFAAQNVTLSSGNWDVLLIISIVGNAWEVTYVVTKNSISDTITNYIEAFNYAGSYFYSRGFKITSETSISFLDSRIGDGSSGTVNNFNNIPYKIYGIKLHHTVEIRAIAPTVSTLAENCVFDPTGTDLESTDVEAAIKELESNFQDGVDAVYDAVVAKGSTPASHSLSDVVDGIAAIQSSPPTQTKSCTPSTSAQTITPDSGYLLSSVSVGAIATQTKSCTPSTSAQTITPDSGKYLTKVSVSAISTQSKTITASRSKQTVTPDSGKYLSSVVVNKYPDASGTYTASSRGASLDMGATNNLRYVNTNSVPNTNSGTYTYPSGSTGGTVDMGATNSYRYVNASNVYAKGKADGDVQHTIYCFNNGRSVRICRSNNSSDYIVQFSADVNTDWELKKTFTI